MENPLTLKSLLALFAADIDIFLLQEKFDKDPNATFTKEEIKNQLIQSATKMNEVLEQHGFNINKPLQPAFLPNLKITNN